MVQSRPDGGFWFASNLLLLQQDNGSFGVAEAFGFSDPIAIVAKALIPDLELVSILATSTRHAAVGVVMMLNAIL